MRRIARRRWEEKGGAKEARTGSSLGNEGCACEGKGVKGRGLYPSRVSKYGREYSFRV